MPFFGRMPNGPRWLLAAIFMTGTMITGGCHQNRYQPAEWRETGESERPKMITGTTLPGTTLPRRSLGTTLPGTTLPGTTLPRFPQRGTASGPGSRWNGNTTLPE
jgi:hypothetical protein